MLSRFAVLAGRSLARVSATKPPCYPALLKSARFYGSVRTSSTQSSVSNELIEALENEIKAEKGLEKENLGGAVRPGVAGFNIAHDQAEVRLTKTHGNEQILVVFNVNHSVGMEESDENPEAAPIPVALPPFSIEITKGDQRLCFNLEMMEAGEEGHFDFRVEEFYIAPAAKENNEEVADQVYASSGQYIDPDLHDILFVRYLEERGFTPEFCQQLVDYATHWEHSRYVDLLTKIKNFVAK